MDNKIKIGNIPVIIWGEFSKKVYIYVHGKLSNKESAKEFAKIADSKGYQVISFDLPEHGERENSNYECNVFNGIADLKEIYNFSKYRWDEINLFACSLGAYFSLLAYKEFEIKKCLFQSPILDMEHLIKNMFLWFNISEDLLRENEKIETPIDVMSWDYYQYVKANPIKNWEISTSIICGTNDNLQNMETIDNFVGKFKCSLTKVDGFEHFFHTEEQMNYLKKWLRINI